jgi:hypothetical protein
MLYYGTGSLYHRIALLYHGTVALDHGTGSLYHGIAPLYHGTVALYYGTGSLYHRIAMLYHGTVVLYHRTGSLSGWREQQPAALFSPFYRRNRRAFKHGVSIYPPFLHIGGLYDLFPKTRRKVR